MKRYLLFVGQQYYPSKALGDLKCAFDSMDEALAAVPGLEEYEWAIIADMTTFKYVYHREGEQ